MLPTATPLILFTDLDGCLLNKHDYDWTPASETLDALRQCKIPVVMNSSKTVLEMKQLANELGLTGNPFISENGSVIYWGSGLHCGNEESKPASKSEVIGASRDVILDLLHSLKPQFRFRSFADLGLAGVMSETQLSEDKAQMALARQGTEPLLWDDSEAHRSEFEQTLNKHQLTLTKGGRFWHVAGRTSKGKAMQQVAKRLLHPDGNAVVAAIGDSPIDQSMLDLADVPIGIPTPNGLGVRVDADRGIVATAQGAAGWAEAVAKLLSQLNVTSSEN
ncbi:Glucosyl-3-phosphoglycerate/mannosyl-3-phosphoglycerate phosphatase [Planctomycetes bacterium CA13]|uniref:Glucosyl-3-phosphoglycerate/mannosyl-3-phosphoglycerate phosphatase n=1 Tax=Novipirellula herctigrandis TaxID=2527986 RepID=A0A5C5YV47_9BACT|nr:Glucosyl-3-phosphoglycerate/mannosyl-3-phosphoglycerate phosphatase [Planctomycetes bacterium CA13]